MGCSMGVVAASTSASEVVQVADAKESALAGQMVETRFLTQLKVIYDDADANGDGDLNEAELKAALARNEELGDLISRAGLRSSASQVMGQLDSNADGRVTFNELGSHLQKTAVEEVRSRGNIEAVEVPAAELASKQLMAIFNGLDENSDGVITREELAKPLRGDDAFRRLVKEAGLDPDHFVLEQLDTNQDGRIVWIEMQAHLHIASIAQVKDTGVVEASIDVADSQSCHPWECRWGA